MKTIISAALLFSSLAMAADAPAFVLGGDVAKGKEKYATVCASCHGPEGKGDGAAAKALNPQPANFTDPANAARLTDEWVYKMIRDGGAANGKSPLMVAWKNSFKDDEIRNMAAYVRSLVYVAPAPAPAKGKPGKKAAK